MNATYLNKGLQTFQLRLPGGVALAILSLTGLGQPVNADSNTARQNGIVPSIASVAPSSLLQADTLKQTPNISGIWHGHAHNKDTDCSITLKIRQTANKLEGSLISVGTEGTANHYIQGTYDAKDGVFIFKDIGVDTQWGAPGFNPMPVDRYELHLVERGAKLVGSANQSTNRLWISATNEQAGPVSPSNPDWTALQSDMKQKNQLSDSGPTQPRNQEPLVKSEYPGRPTVPSPDNSLDPKIENDLSAGGKVTPATLAYSIFVEQVITQHWHPPKSSNAPQRVDLHMRINNEGSISDIRPEAVSANSPGETDEFINTCIEAIQSVSSYVKPPQNILNDLRSNHVDLCIGFINGRDEKLASSKGAQSYMNTVQKIIKQHWLGSAKELKEQRRIRVFFRIKKDGFISNLNVDPFSRVNPHSEQIDACSEVALAAVRACSPFPMPPEALVSKQQHVDISFTFDYQATESQRRYTLPLFIPTRAGLLLLGL